MMNTLLEFLRTCWPALLATALAAYLLGSVNCAIIVTRLLDKTEMPERRMCCAHRESCPRC